MDFSPISISENVHGWGPMHAPEIFSDVPYAPFSKSDKLGKVADFTHSTRWGQDRFGRDFNAHAEEDADFQIVDTKSSKPKAFRRHYGRGRRYEKDTGPEQDKNQRPTRNRREREQAARRQFTRRWQRDEDKVLMESSVEVKPNWEVVKTMDLGQMAKQLKMGTADKLEAAAEDVMWCGSLKTYNKTYDRVTTRAVKKLEASNATFHTVTTTDDPIIRESMKSCGANVFATDAILSCIAAAPRSVYSWDIVIERVGDYVFFDKRDDSQFDFLTVNETSHTPPSNDDPTDINSLQSLGAEATMINQNFSQQVLKEGTSHAFARGNPFASADEVVASVAYRYRKFKLDDKITVMCRCAIDAVTPAKKGPVLGEDGEPVLGEDGKPVAKKPLFMMLRALNEYDPKASGLDWRRKLDSQRGAVLANELKNNSNKLGRWTAQAILAGADLMKIGYVSRFHPGDKWTHQILGTQMYKPREFAKQINLNVYNMWGIIRYIADLVMKQPTGHKYVLLKDPNKPTLLLYKVPEDAFDSDQSSEEDEDDEDDSDDESESESEDEEAAAAAAKAEEEAAAAKLAEEEAAAAAVKAEEEAAAAAAAAAKAEAEAAAAAAAKKAEEEAAAKKKAAAAAAAAAAKKAAPKAEAPKPKPSGKKKKGKKKKK